LSAAAEQPHIGLVVEGSGDIGAVPMLLRRHLQSQGFMKDILGKPIPLNGKGSATAEDGIERYVATAAIRPGCRAVVVVLDADKEPTCVEGPTLLARAQTRVHVPVLVALAERDFEDWMYCSIESMELGTIDFQVGKNGGSVIEAALYPRSYVKPTWQPRLTSRMDLELAAGRSVSLRRLLDRVVDFALLT
jgi:hypothetical protein